MDGSQRTFLAFVGHASALVSLLVVTVLSSCRHDESVVPVSRDSLTTAPTTLCDSLTESFAFDTDTIVRWNSQEGVATIHMSIAAEPVANYGDIRLSAWSTAVWLSPGSGYDYDEFTYISASSEDSLGLFLKRMEDPYRLVPFAVGDTLDPFHALSPSRPLYEYVVGGLSPFVLNYPTWYVGMVKIIDGKEHVGFVRIGSDQINDGRRYWFEGAKLADCPELPLVITDP